MIDRQTIDRIMEATNIVDVVSDFVTLRKRGANYIGLCPFHEDRTPSFSVSPSRGVCKCFACGEGGNTVNFLMKHEQITYPEALRWLANKYHIEIKERELSADEKQAENDRESMFIVNDWAASYFEDKLWNDDDGRAIGMQYFRSRGFRDDIIKKFRLGFSPVKRESMPSEALAKGYKERFLLTDQEKGLGTGLCYKRDNGQLVDRFAGRVIFPWLNISGKVVAFGGRKLDAATKGVQQKYVNSPGSIIYHKEAELYGLYQAKRAISKEDCVFMVEGYTDVISMHQCGIENVVANSGTALSMKQVRLLHRFTRNIVLLYDGDAAGIKAAMRGTDMLLSEGMNIKVLILPDGDDPDSFARKHSAAELKEYIEKHQTDFMQFKTDILLRGVNDPIKRSEAITSIVKSISVIPDHIVRATYLQDCSHRLGISEAALTAQMNKFIRDERETQKREGQSPSGTSAQSATAGSNAVAGTQPAAAPHASQNTGGTVPVGDRMQRVEMMIMRMLVQHGSDIVYSNVETEDGGTTSMTLGQYMRYDLAQDELQMNTEVGRRILEECAEKSSEEGFSSVHYFVNHPDVEISSLASRLAADDVMLSKSMQVEYNEEMLRGQAVHVLLDFRMEFVKRKLQELRLAMAQVASDPEQMMKVMAEYRDMQNIRNALASRLGQEIVV